MENKAGHQKPGDNRETSNTRHSKMGKRKKETMEPTHLEDEQWQDDTLEQSSTPSKIPPVYISKYNRFVDNIISKINSILGKSYDPVRVKIQPSNAIKKTKNTNKNSNKTNKKNSTKRKSNRRPTYNRKPAVASNKMGELEVARAHESEAREPAFVLVSKTSDALPKRKNSTVEIRATPIGNNNNNKRTKTKSKTKNKTKSSNSRKVPKVRAILFGLSSLRRDGDVNVLTNSEHTTVKSDFALGPLILRVEKEFGRGAKKALKSATATTAEMFGRLNLRIIHGGAATLHSIKVLQPKQVRVDSADNHEKTKEFMWRRSAKLAKVVSRKLSAAVKSMLQPPPGA